MDKQHVNVDLELDDRFDTSDRQAVLAELKRCRDEGQRHGYTLTDAALEELADRVLSHTTVKDPRPLGSLLAQWIKERARPTERQAGRMLISVDGNRSNRKARRAAKANARRSK